MDFFNLLYIKRGWGPRCRCVATPRNGGLADSKLLRQPSKFPKTSCCQSVAKRLKVLPQQLISIGEVSMAKITPIQLGTQTGAPWPSDELPGLSMGHVRGRVRYLLMPAMLKRALLADGKKLVKWSGIPGPQPSSMNI